MSELEILRRLRKQNAIWALKCCLFIFFIFIIFATPKVEAATYNPHFEFLGGLIDDQALIQSGGRELQPFKMVRVIAGLDIEIDDKWSSKCELVLIGEHVEHDPNNKAQVDWYKSIGSELLYYGDYPVRNCYLETRNFKIGRMINSHGLTNYSDWYLHRHDAPHALYFDRELLNGVSYNYGILTAAILSGRGRPDSDYNWYLEGQTDPNIKDNNTPIVELQLDYRGFYVGYHRNKTGSAPGNIYNGKYNDNRMAFGFNRKFGNLTILGQSSFYEIGLTESGEQGLESPYAKNIKKVGYFTTVNFKGLQYTYEQIDRIDSKVYYTYGDTDSQEISHIYSYNYKNIQVFYRKIKNDFPELSNMKPGDNSYKFGVLIHKEF